MVGALSLEATMRYTARGCDHAPALRPRGRAAPRPPAPLGACGPPGVLYTWFLVPP